MKGRVMSKKEKLIAKLKNKPRDFTFTEMKNLLELLEFKISHKGKTSGSRIKFNNGDIPILLHKPHPQKELFEYQLKYIIDILEKERLI